MLLIGMTIRTAVVFNSLNVYLVLITSAFTGLSGTHYAYDLASDRYSRACHFGILINSSCFTLYSAFNGSGRCVSGLTVSIVYSHVGC
jgi:hypothetical protein